MRKVAIHMIRWAANRTIAETYCLHRSLGGGVGRMVFDFAGERGPFLGTEQASLVTCKGCLKRLAKAEQGDG